MSGHVHPLRHPYLFLALVFVVSRLLAEAAGVPFTVRPLYSYMQVIDAALLRDDLLSSLWHLHSQPPLYNLLLGLVLKLAPAHFEAIFYLLWLGMSFASCAGMLWLLLRCGVKPLWALLLTTLFCVSPGLIMYEHSLSYTSPELLLLILSALCLAKFTEEFRKRWGIAFFAVLAMLIGVHSLFQHVFLLAALGLLLWRFRPQRNIVLLCAALPLLLVMGWYGKNWVLYGHFATSSWGGMNIMRTLNTEFLKEEDREAMIASGVLSPLSRIPAFSRLTHYATPCEVPEKFSRIPLLNAPEKSGGYINHHHYYYLCLSDAYMKDALAIIAQHPQAYFKRMGVAWWGYFIPADQMFLLEEQRAPMRFYAEWFDTVFFGKIPLTSDWNDVNNTIYPVLILLVCVAFARGVQLAASGRDIVIIFILFSAFYVTLIGNLIEVSENNRYRFLLEPFLLLMLAAPLGRKS
ncbi:MAG: hypothetical protein J0L97_05135 [Alphaproteobacteria bacterium]|nr:hypothetical protein [Alphaproteobacteria bacterium]